MSQLALSLSLQDRGVFESFWPSSNEALVSYLTSLTDAAPRAPISAGCWLWGGTATGKTHLLHAVCERLGDDAVFLPLEHFVDAGPGILDGLASRRAVCLDNIDAVVGIEAFELALFALLNQIADLQGLVVVSAKAAPRDCGFRLADLQSRLSRLPVFRVEPLDEAGRVQALRLRASQRGLELPDDTAKFLLNRSRRDMTSLYRLLDTLDREALIAQRRLTIPFVREVMQRLEPPTT